MAARDCPKQQERGLLRGGAAVCQAPAKAGWAGGTRGLAQCWQVVPSSPPPHAAMPGIYPLLSHAPICSSTQRWKYHPGAFHGRFVWVPRATRGTRRCWTGFNGAKVTLCRHG